MDKLAELQVKRDAARKKVYQLRDEFQATAKTDAERRWATPEKRTEWEAVNKEFDDLGKEIVTLTDAAQIASRAQALQDEEARERHTPNPKSGRMPGMNDPAVRSGDKPATPDQEERSLAMAGWCRAQMGEDISEAQEQAMTRCRMKPWQRQVGINLNGPRYTKELRDIQATFRSRPHTARNEAESRAMTGLDYNSGGALVPETFLRTLDINMLAFGGIRQAATMLVTGTGEALTVPTADDTSNSGERLGESASIGSSVEPSFGSVTWNAYKYSSKAILVPHELLEDSFIDLPSYLGGIMGERIGRKTATDFTTGAGAASPRGIVTAASSGVTAASATAMVYDDIIRLEHSVDMAYRSGAAYACHDSVKLALRLLKDGVGRYIWEDGTASGGPDTLNGRPCFTFMEMASTVEASAKVLLFGQLGNYRIRRVNQIRMYRLEELYRGSDQDGFISLVREDGNYMGNTTSSLKYLIMHS